MSLVDPVIERVFERYVQLYRDVDKPGLDEARNYVRVAVHGLQRQFGGDYGDRFDAMFPPPPAQPQPRFTRAPTSRRYG